MTDTINSLYSIKPLPDIYIDSVNATKKRYYLDFDISIKNKGLVDGGGVVLTISIESDEVKEVEDLVNIKIKAGLKIVRDEMTLEEAMNSGAQGEFGAKYPDIVSVYAIMDSSEESGWFSKEICTGPHVENTKEIGEFKIIKETSVSAGILRIKGTVV